MTSIANWRERGQLLRGTAYACSKCRGVSVVRRRCCSHCGAISSGQPVRLDGIYTVLGWSHGEPSIEIPHLTAQPSQSVLLQVAAGSKLALTLAAADSLLGPSVIGKNAMACVRRSETPEKSEPHRYIQKAKIVLSERLNQK